MSWMNHFDEIGKRLSDAGQNVVQQTKNFSDTSRLNGSISEKEKQIVQLYTAIGRAYYEQHKDDPSAEQPEQIAQINTLSAEIAQLREEIKQIKGVVKCPGCGAELPLNATFCSSCGAKIVQSAAAAAAPAGARVCPRCGAAVAEGNRFCTGCGAKMEEPEA